MVEALYVGCRLVGYEPVLTWLEKTHQRHGLSLAVLQQRFRLPPHRPLPPQRIPQHALQSYDDLVLPLGLRTVWPAGLGGEPPVPGKGQGLLEVCPSSPGWGAAPTVSCAGTAPDPWPPSPPPRLLLQAI